MGVKKTIWKRRNNMGVLKKITDEYFGDTIRKEDIIELPDGVIVVDFTDNNGNRHIHGYRVEHGVSHILDDLIYRVIEERGYECDLNDIDVSNIKDMEALFKDSGFNGDISGWDVSSVENMENMFYESEFDGDLSKWDVSKVTNMHCMFCGSNFSGKNGSIEGWNVGTEVDLEGIFAEAPIDQNPPSWAE